MKYCEDKVRVMWRREEVIEEAWQILGGRTFQEEESAGAKAPRRKRA